MLRIRKGLNLLRLYTYDEAFSCSVAFVYTEVSDTHMMHRMFAIAALSAITVFAQGMGPGSGRPDRTPPTAEEMAERRVAFLTNYLTLTPSQVTQAKTIFADEQKAAEALRSPMEAAQTALQTAVKSNASDAQIEAAAAQVGTLHGQAAAIRGKAQAKFRALLTPEQQTKLDAMRHGPGGGPHGPGMRGFGGRR